MGYAGYKLFSCILQLLFFLDVLLKSKNMGVQAFGELVNITRRITSYNVCYTKLLRIGRPP